MADFDKLREAAKIHRQLQRAPTDLPVTHIQVLLELHDSGPKHPKDLAEAIGFTTGGITTVIDRLEDDGFAIREPDRNDRRKIQVEITKKGTRHLREIARSMDL